MAMRSKLFRRGGDEVGLGVRNDSDEMSEATKRLSWIVLLGEGVVASEKLVLEGDGYLSLL